METYAGLHGANPARYPSAWYAFDAGGARIYVLQATWPNGNRGTADGYQQDYDHHWSPAGAEYRWLQKDLATHARRIKFAVFHNPLYSVSLDEMSDRLLQGAGSLEGLLSRYGVDIAFTGHAHLYQRNNANGPTGLISYVTGGGGAPVEAVSAGSCSALGGIVAYAVGWSTISGQGSACGAAPVPTTVEQVFHFLAVTVSRNTVTVAPTDEVGRTFDVQTFAFPADARHEVRRRRPVSSP
jgi:hypothetical protein